MVAVLAFVGVNDQETAQAENPSSQARELRALRARVAALPTAAELDRQGDRVGSLGQVAQRQDEQLVSVDAQLRNLRQRIEALEDATP